MREWNDGGNEYSNIGVVQFTYIWYIYHLCKSGDVQLVFEGNVRPLVAIIFNCDWISWVLQKQTTIILWKLKVCNEYIIMF